MKSDSSHSLLAAVAGVAVLLFLLCPRPAPARPQTNDAPQILFLHLRIQQQTVSLVATNLRPGVLKPALNLEPEGVHYSVVATNGQRLWQGTLADPCVRQLEYEDPPHSGQLVRKAIPLEESEFTVRIPFSPAAQRIDFYKLEPAGPGGGAEQALKKPLGSIPLSLNPPPAPR